MTGARSDIFPMSFPTQTAVRVIAALIGAAMLAVGVTLGYIAAIAARRSEGVFLPAGYVAIACLMAGGLLIRVALRQP